MRCASQPPGDGLPFGCSVYCRAGPRSVQHMAHQAMLELAVRLPQLTRRLGATHSTLLELVSRAPVRQRDTKVGAFSVSWLLCARAVLTDAAFCQPQGCSTALLSDGFGSASTCWMSPPLWVRAQPTAVDNASSNIAGHTLRRSKPLGIVSAAGTPWSCAASMSAPGSPLQQGRCRPKWTSEVAHPFFSGR